MIPRWFMTEHFVSIVLIERPLVAEITYCALNGHYVVSAAIGVVVKTKQEM